MKYKTGIMFGVFDGLHPGHQFVLSTALDLVETLYVVVASDASVRELKSKDPFASMEQRSMVLEAVSDRIKTLSGDAVLGSWTGIRTVHPDVVLVGYDQTELHTALIKDFPNREFAIEMLPPFEPEKYHSSLL